MYIDNENFERWMEKLSKKLTEITYVFRTIEQPKAIRNIRV